MKRHRSSHAALKFAGSILVVALVVALMVHAGLTTSADIVLLDEEWSPELKINSVIVTPIDTEATGAATEAKEGTKSTLLENAQGWPNVRFRNATSIVLSDIPPGTSQAKLWYRTNSWDGTWQIQIWVYYQAAGQPVKVLEGMLDGGGDSGELIADNQWRKAVAVLDSAGEYDSAPKDTRLPTYVWLLPKSGWNKVHRTYVDRIEIIPGEVLPEVREALKSPTEVHPRPGAQTTGPTWVWWEAEDAVAHTFPPGGAFAPDNVQQQEKLSNGAWLQHHNGAGLTGRWNIDLAASGTYAFWARKFWKHGPFKWRWNEGDWRICGRDIALADNVTLRLHLCANWVYLGEVELPAGENTLQVEALPEATAIAFDCFLLSKGPFMPDGANKPGTKYNRAEEGWFPFEPDPDHFGDEALLDLRSLNQKRAGEDGFVKADGMSFIFENTRQPVQFWAVNASCDFDDRSSVRYLARRLAKLGVNLVRVHGPIWDPVAPDLTTIDRRRLDQLHYFVAAMADEGIYTKISFYFPLWVAMKDEYGFLGYKQGAHPFALLFFHPRFQDIYKSWVQELMTSQNHYTGKSLADDPAVAIIEVVNEDNFLFWTFQPGESPPTEVMALLEETFGRWLIAKYGSLDAAVAAWGTNERAPAGDDFTLGRVGLYSAGQLTGAGWARAQRNEKRASDQLQFLTEHLRQFYTEMATYFQHELGVKCAISATNWQTADSPLLGALDKYTNMACDVMDRHAYFGSSHKGEAASYSLRTGHTYTDTTGMFGPRSLVKELQYVGHPHIVSEYNYPMPNRFRAECPWLAATYGRLCGTDAYFHFALGKADWLRTHTKFSIYSPVYIGQFPALALLYRNGYVEEGPVMAHSAVRLADLYQFKGTPVMQEQNLDQLRKADVPVGSQLETDTVQAIDPLAYYVGQVTMAIAEDPGTSTVTDLSPYVDRENKIARSATGELVWDWGKGVVALNATHAQGACGFLAEAGAIELNDITIRSENEYATVMAVSMDGQPLLTSERILLQVMTEDRNYGWKTREVKVEGKRRKKITSLGAPPIVVRQIAGLVSFKRADATELRVTGLDHNGYRRQELAGSAANVRLLPDCLYYVISK